MYLFSRRARLAPGNTRASMTWASGITEKANQITGLNIVVPAHGTFTWHTRWCSGNPTSHTALSTWTGTDSKGQPVVAVDPVVTLLKK